MKKIRSLNLSQTMRIVALVMLTACCLSPLKAGVLNADTQIVNINLNKATLLNVIWELQKQTDFSFIYSTSDVEKVEVKSLNVKDKPIKKVLDECLAGTDLEYTINNDVIAIRKAEKKAVPAMASQQEEKDAVGKVLDEEGAPIIGASVVYGTTGAITDYDGVFTIKNVPVGTTLTISMIGFDSQQVKFTGKNIHVVLKQASFAMDEVIVVAYGEQKRSAFTGSASTVNAESITKRPVTNVMSSLEGLSTGVQISAPSGAPNSTPSFLIRGVSSVSAGTSPLIILDGMPYNGSWNHINPNDVDNISVLKDASSTALYGARGANGVVLITTKKAKRGEPVITFDSKVGFTTRRADRYETIKDPAQYYEMHYQALYNNNIENKKWDTARAHREANEAFWKSNQEGGLGGYVVFTAPENEYLIGTNGKMNPNAQLGRLVTNERTGEQYWITPDDWRNEAYKTGIRQDYTLSVSGGSDRLQLMSSIAYTKETGIVEASDYERFTGRINFGYQLKRWLKFSANTSIAKSIENSASSSVFSTIDRMAPIFPIYLRDANGNIMHDSNGKMYDYGDAEVNGLTRPVYKQSSPFQTNALNTSKNRSLGITGQAALDISITEDLKAKISVNYGNRENRGISTGQPFYGNPSTKGSVSVSQYKRETLHMLQQLNYSKLINKHNIQVLAAHEYYKNKYFYLSGSRTNMYSYFENQELDGAIIETGNSSYTTDYRNEGYLFRALYDYDNTYFLSAHYRRDASTNFHPDHRWGNFYSFGAAWMISQEDWFNVPQIDALKLKVAYGQNGNDAIGTSRYEDTFTINNVDGDIALLFNSKGKKDITWETKSSANIGAEFELFKSRIRGSVEYYNSKTTNMLASISIPLSSGYNAYYDNIGNMRNSGVEFEIHGDIIRNQDLRWSMYINGSHNKNKILKLADERKTIDLYDIDKKENVSRGYYSGLYFYGEGLSYYTFRTRKWAGLNENGQATWYVTDMETNETTTTTNHSSASDYYCGDAAPKLIGGFGTSVEWKGFDLSVAFAYRIGGLAYDNQYSSLMGVPYEERTGYAFHKDLLKAWTKENPNSDIPRWQYDDKYNSSTSDRFLLNASYLKLQNINLGYTFDKNLMSKVGVKNLRLSVSADNLFYLSKRKGFNPSRSFNGNLATDGYTEVTRVIFNLEFKF